MVVRAVLQPSDELNWTLLSSPAAASRVPSGLNATAPSVLRR